MEEPASCQGGAAEAEMEEESRGAVPRRPWVDAGVCGVGPVRQRAPGSEGSRQQHPVKAGERVSARGLARADRRSVAGLERPRPVPLPSCGAIPGAEQGQRVLREPRRSGMPLWSEVICKTGGAVLPSTGSITFSKAKLFQSAFSLAK